MAHFDVVVRRVVCLEQQAVVTVAAETEAEAMEAVRRMADFEIGARAEGHEDGDCVSVSPWRVDSADPSLDELEEASE